jgi:hypothetical protein
VTIAITEQPPQFVRVLFGHERIAPDDSPATLKRYRKLIDEFNEAVVAEQIEKYRAVALATQAAEVEQGTTARGRARRKAQDGPPPATSTARERARKRASSTTRAR